MSSVCVCDWGAAKSQVILKSTVGVARLQNFATPRKAFGIAMCALSQGADSALPNTSSQPPTAANLPPTIVTTLAIGSIFPMDLIAMSGYNQVCFLKLYNEFKWWLYIIIVYIYMVTSKLNLCANYLVTIYFSSYISTIPNIYIYISIYWLVIC